MLLLEGPCIAYVIDRFVYIYIYAYCINLDLKSAFGRSMSLFVPRNTQNRTPHRDTLLRELTKNLEKDLKGKVLVTLYEEE